MPRPKLSEGTKKVKLNLTVSPEHKEMLDFIRTERNMSISEIVEEFIGKEYKRLGKVKAKKSAEHTQINYPADHEKTGV